MCVKIALPILVVVWSIPSAISNLPSLDGRIVGGQEVSIFYHPYQLSLQHYGSHICGASLIRPNVALTAAHCVPSNDYDVKSYMIIAGTSYIYGNAIRVPIARFYTHPQYNRLNSDFDISLIRLESPLALGAYILPVALPELNEEVPVNTNAVVTGWGYTKELGGVVTSLRSLRVPIIDSGLCGKLYYSKGVVTPRMLCAGYVEGKFDACQGDSGGPLLANGKLVGIVSWGYGCARPNYPGVYTKVSKFRNWIERAIVRTNL